MSEPDMTSPQPARIRPPFVAALVLLVGVGLVGGAFALGWKRATPSLGPGEVAALRELHSVGESGLDASIAGVVQTDDDQLRLAMVVQQTLAAQVSTISFAVLMQSDETPTEADPPRIFDESTWSDLSQPERDAAFRRECTEWAEHLAASTAAAVDDVDDRLRPLLVEFDRGADDLAGLCSA